REVHLLFYDDDAIVAGRLLSALPALDLLESLAMPVRPCEASDHVLRTAAGLTRLRLWGRWTSANMPPLYASSAWSRLIDLDICRLEAAASALFPPFDAVRWQRLACRDEHLHDDLVRRATALTGLRLVMTNRYAPPMNGLDVLSALT